MTRKIVLCFYVYSISNIFFKTELPSSLPRYIKQDKNNILMAWKLILSDIKLFNHLLLNKLQYSVFVMRKY